MIDKRQIILKNYILRSRLLLLLCKEIAHIVHIQVKQEDEKKKKEEKNK